MKSAPSFLVPILLITLLAGCASLQPEYQPGTKVPTAPPLLNWEVYEQTLRSIQSWQVKGKIGVRVPDDAISASINWQQYPESYSIYLSGPLGQGSTWIRGENGQVTLTRGNQAALSASTPEALMQNNLGWSLPISELHYWVRGISSPNSPVITKQHGVDGELIALQQQGWTLNFERYQNVGSWFLPGKLTAQQGDLKLTLSIKEWNLQ
jgi:outer membrane lipoprotein LolB